MIVLKNNKKIETKNSTWKFHENACALIPEWSMKNLGL